MKPTTLILNMLTLLFFGILPATASTIDYGDAPDVYSTMITSNGAGHHISDLFLGTTVDSESDGQPDSSATGDDLNGLNDDDGVFFSGALLRDSRISIDVTASSGNSYLNAWIDYNQNGNWSDCGEWVLSDIALVKGTQNLFIEIPAGATLGNTYARFRLTSQQSPGYVGIMEDGEVEDYMVKIVDSVNPDPVPEPATMMLFGIGLLSLAGVTRKKKY